MINNSVLNLCIALIFTYLLYSLLATILQEIIATNFGFRAYILQKALTRMLEDEATTKMSVVGRLKNYGYLFAGKKISPESLVGFFYNHPLIKFLAEDQWHKRPSYIAPENFSAVIIDLLRGDVFEVGDDYSKNIQRSLKSGEAPYKLNDNRQLTIPASALRYLRSMYLTSQGDISKFQTQLEAWFNFTMERATGWYKKYVQVLLFFIGFILAVSFNVDSIAITRKLSANPKLADQLANNAAAYMSHQSKELTGNPDPLNKKVTQSAAMATNELIHDGLTLSRQEITDNNQLISIHGRNCLSLLGWFITAIAISMGSPFWFDLLNKFMSLRGPAKPKVSDNKAGARSSTQPVG